MAGWAPLTADGSDPIPGDPNQVRGLQGWFQRMAEDVNGASSDLRNVRGSTEWKSPAAQEFQQHLSDLEGDFGKLSSSFGRAASGLGTYATALATARTNAHGLLVQAQQSPQDQTKLQQLRQQLVGFQDDRNRAAIACIDVLDQAEHLGLRNSFGSWFSQHVAPVFTGMWHWVDAHLQDISDWCTRIGLALAVIGLFVPGLQWLEVVAMAVMAVGLLADLGLTLEGKMDWKMFVFEVAVTVATLGLGMVAGRLGKAAVGLVEEARTPLEDAAKAASGLLAKRQAALADAIAGGKGARSLAAFKGWVSRATTALASATKDLAGATKSVQAFTRFVGEGQNPITALVRGGGTFASDMKLVWQPGAWKGLPTAVVKTRWSLISWGASQLGSLSFGTYQFTSTLKDGWALSP